MKSDGVIIAEIRVFADGDWEYTGNTKAISGGPDGWDSTKEELASVIDYGLNHYQQFEIFGAHQYVYKKEETA